MIKLRYLILAIFLISSCGVNRTIQVKLIPDNTDTKNLGIVHYINVSADTSGVTEKKIAEKLGISDLKVVSFQHIQPKIENDSLDSKTIFLVGRKLDSIVIIPDVNNNNSFDDDEALIVHKEILMSRSLKELARLPFVNLQNLQTLYQGKKYIFSRKMFLLPDSIRTGELQLTLISNEQFKGRFKYKGKKYFVNARLNSPYKILADSLSQLNIRITDAMLTSKSEFNEEEILHLYDTARINRNILIVHSVSPDLSDIILQLLSQTTVSLPQTSETIRRYMAKPQKINFTRQQYPYLNVLTDKTGFLLNGKIIFLNFWFANCLPCIAEFNSLNHLYESFKNDTTFKMISLTFESPQVVEKFREKYRLLFDIYSLSTNTINQLNLTPLFPTNIIIDREGIVNEYFVGGQTDSKLAYEYFKKLIIPHIELLLSSNQPDKL